MMVSRTMRLLAAPLLCIHAAQAKKPHIVYVLADDYGWANLGVHRRGGSEQGRAEVHTPSLDGLIDEGVLLDRHYAYAICSPSRSSLQSGRLAVHVNDINKGVTVMNPLDPVSGSAGMPRNMTGMASKLRSAGYRTHAVGKWDVGMVTPEHTPWGRGYDTWLGYYQHANDYWRKDMNIMSTGEIDNCLNKFMDLSMHNATYRGGVHDARSNSPDCLTDPESHPLCYEEEMFKERVLEIIDGHDAEDEDAPLFLFYSFHLLHSPLQVPKRYLERMDAILEDAGVQPFDTANRRTYAAMTMYMDEAVGQMVDALKAKGMWEDTLLVFSSDNGGPVYEPGASNNHPLRGGKFSDLEGGVRVNAFVSGGFVPEAKRGGVFEGVISIADWYGTFCELAGVDATDHAAIEANVWLKERGLPLLPPVDSVAQWGFLLNGTNGRPELQISADSLLQWPYKLVMGKPPYATWTGEVYPNCSTIASMENGDGPKYVGGKVFDVPLNLTNSTAELDHIMWKRDCTKGCLFNVRDDPTEHIDLAEGGDESARLAKMMTDLAEMNKGLFHPDRGTVNAEACQVSIDIGMYYGPFVGAKNWYSPAPPLSPSEQVTAEIMKEELRLVNNGISVMGVEKAADMFMPILVKVSNHTFDKCLAPPQPESLLVV